MTGRKPRHLGVQPGEAVHPPPAEPGMAWGCGSAAVPNRVTDLPISLSGRPMYKPGARSLLTNIRSERGQHGPQPHPLRDTERPDRARCGRPAGDVRGGLALLVFRCPAAPPKLVLSV